MIKLLIADDERMEREALADIVARRFAHTADIHMAENGRQAADVAVLWGADLVLMDIEMPGMNGIEAAKKILAQLPQCKIIFVTAYSLFQYAHEAVRLGASDYILKPADPDDAERAIHRAIRQLEAERQLAALAPEAAPEHETPDSADAPQMAQLMRHVQHYLQDNYMADLSLDSVSDILHISPSYLSAQFKRHLHVNFIDYLTELRIHAAQQLLRDPLRSTAEVAAMVGYEDANYFTKAFKKKTGMTPTQFRRQSAGRVGAAGGNP